MKEEISFIRVQKKQLESGNEVERVFEFIIFSYNCIKCLSFEIICQYSLLLSCHNKEQLSQNECGIQSDKRVLITFISMVTYLQVITIHLLERHTEAVNQFRVTGNIQSRHQTGAKVKNIRRSPAGCFCQRTVWVHSTLNALMQQRH